MDMPKPTVEHELFASRTGSFLTSAEARRRKPVEAYLDGQGRYRHLFEPERNEEALAKIQEQVDSYWAALA